MKRPTFSSRGFALILVLGLVVLVISVVVAFLLNVSTERSASGGYAAAVSARQFGDTAVNVVEAQINHATTYVPTGARNVAWTSQPGLLRTFDQDGLKLSLYKLYSADRMITGAPGDLDLDTPPLDWNSRKSLWVDLNERAPAGIDPATGKENYLYPILDPRAVNTIDGMTGLNNVGLKIDGSAPAVSNIPKLSDGTTPAPMPVRWLYILKNGELVLPGSLSGSPANVVGVSAETATNPIVGRVAFWTDDETAKVNINTASEGAFWDTPRSFTEQEVFSLAVKQPARGEYQRYPGHPATVSLSAIFPAMPAEYIYSLSPRVMGEYDNPNGTGWTTKGGFQTAAAVSNPVNPLLGIHSDGDRLYTSLDELMFAAKRDPAKPTQRVSAAALASTLIYKGVPATVPLTRNILESRRFFLTAQSRAPELNLFNLPRIAMWPIYRLGPFTGNANTPSLSNQIDVYRTSAFDRTIALCSSLGTIAATGQYPSPYFFQRQLSLNSFNDLGDPSLPTTTGAIPRNVDLYRYLQALTNTKIPGYGGNTFLNKYPADRDQILTEMFDYVRCTNLYDDLLDYNTGGSTISPLGQYTFTSALSSVTGTNGHGVAAPIHGPGGTLGQGRYYTLRELNYQIIACAEQGTTVPVEANPSTLGTGNNKENVMLRPYDTRGDASTYALLKKNETRVQVMAFPDMYTTMVGWRIAVPDCRIEIEDLDKMTITDSQGQTVNANLPKKASFNGIGDPFILGGGTGAGGSLVYNWALLKQTLTVAQAPPANWVQPIMLTPTPSGTDYGPTKNMYPFVGWPVTVSNVGGQFTVNEVTVKLRIYMPRVSDPDVLPVQTFRIKIPKVLVPIPTVPGTATTNPYIWGHSFYTDGHRVLDTDTTTTTHTNHDAGRLRVTNNDGLGDRLFASGYDVRRGVVPSHGDYRIIASAIEVPPVGLPDDVYIPVPNFEAPKALVATMVTSPNGFLVTGAGVTDGDLPLDSTTTNAAGTTVATNRFLQNKKTTGPANGTGDFDRGVGWSASGAGANKPDEGDYYRDFAPKPAALKDPNDGGDIPYYSHWNSQHADGATFFSPNRMIPSPVMFGSLPTGARSSPPVPWRTLLFRPLSKREAGHIGSSVAPKDYLLLDLFWMPVVDPYPISDRFSTAGKINLNHQIIPFSYIERTTSLRAALKAERMALIATGNTTTPNIFSSGFTPTVIPTDTRMEIDADQMIAQFDATRFKESSRVTQGKNVFISPSEICEMYMTPKGLSYANMDTELGSNSLTGDNLREKIYATTYQKFTTKSNTYTVHFRAQSVKRAPGSTIGTFTEGRDPVLGEYRGSTVIERYIDPAAVIPDYASPTVLPNITNALTMDHFYKWRVIQNTQFAP